MFLAVSSVLGEINICFCKSFLRAFRELDNFFLVVL